MSPQPRRTRKSAHKGKPNSQPPPQEALPASEDEGSETTSVTRCVCGEQHNVGLMVQCDQCEVWQHCDCVGLTEEELPDHYYCDECQPENHAVLKIQCRFKRAYGSKDINTPVKKALDEAPEVVQNNNDTRATKRRKRAQGENARQQRQAASHGPGGNSRPHRASPAVELRLSNSRSASPEHQAQATWSREDDRLSLQLAVSDSDDLPLPRSNKQDSPPSVRRKKPPVAATRRGNMLGHPLPNANALPSNRCSTGSGSKAHPKHPHHSLGHPSPQMPEESCYDAPFWNEVNGCPSREASPPARVKLPHSKMSWADMNKRAKQILDYIGKLQVELADHDNHPPVETPPHCRQRSLSVSSSSSSLSSASTLPLLLDEEVCTTDPSPLSDATSPTTPIPHGHGRTGDETTLEIMDRVTRELIKFQRKFGALSQQPNRMPGKLPIKR